jgi:hypothetical protein
MSHAGRRIATTAAAAAAVALPVAAAGAAHADTLPLVGSLPVVGGIADTAASGGLTSALPLSGLPALGGATSALSGLPLVGGLAQGGSPLAGLPGLASLTGNGGSSPLNGLPVVGGLTNSLGKGGLPVVGSLPVVGNLAGLGSGAAQGGSAVAPTSAQSVPMQGAQREGAGAVSQAPAAAEHAAAQGSKVTTDAQQMTAHYLGKHKKA